MLECLRVHYVQNAHVQRNCYCKKTVTTFFEGGGHCLFSISRVQRFLFAKRQVIFGVFFLRFWCLGYPYPTLNDVAHSDTKSKGKPISGGIGCREIVKYAGGRKQKERKNKNQKSYNQPFSHFVSAFSSLSSVFFMQFLIANAMDGRGNR